MVRTTEQNSVSFNKQVYIGDTMVMNLIANIDISNPEKMSYTPAIIDTNLYMQNLDEIAQVQREFENKIFRKQQELIKEERNEKEISL